MPIYDLIMERFAMILEKVFRRNKNIRDKFKTLNLRLLTDEFSAFLAHLIIPNNLNFEGTKSQENLINDS